MKVIYGEDENTEPVSEVDAPRTKSLQFTVKIGPSGRLVIVPKIGLRN